MRNDRDGDSKIAWELNKDKDKDKEIAKAPRGDAICNTTKTMRVLLRLSLRKGCYNFDFHPALRHFSTSPFTYCKKII